MRLVVIVVVRRVCGDIRNAYIYTAFYEIEELKRFIKAINETSTPTHTRTQITNHFHHHHQATTTSFPIRNKKHHL